MGCRCAPTATTHSRSAIGASVVITPPNPAAPVRPNRPGPATSPPGSSAPTATPSPSRTPTSARGRGCGASGSPCSVQACSSRPWPANARPPVADCIGPAPAPPPCPSIACAGSASASPWRSAPMTAHTVGCTPIVTLSPRPWRPASNSPIPTTPPPRASITDLPTPCGRGWPPGKSGRAQSTGTSHQHHQMVWARPGPAATLRRPLLSKQHSTHPRTDQAHSLDVAGPVENNQPPN